MKEYALMIPSQMNCWNEAAVVAGCDPNADDDCLCGPFFDAVTSCTAAMCNMGENLGMLCWILRTKEQSANTTNSCLGFLESCLRIMKRGSAAIGEDMYEYECNTSSRMSSRDKQMIGRVSEEN